jgi:serine/threonine protein kinase
MILCINPYCSQPKNSAQVLFCESCGSELLLESKYRVARLMSNKGGFGNTYEVMERDESKVLKVLKSYQPKEIELFEREFRILSNLSGEGITGIPKVEDLFLYTPRDSTQALYCLVMERIYGMDLEEYLKVTKRAINEKTAVGWLSQLVQILQKIHQQGIFHRDIKPSNIILQPDGQLVLIDFGAAKERDPNSASQATCIHTPGYAAPEQQTTGEASPQSDFFALGRTFVYLLTDTSPIELYDSYQDQVVWRPKAINISTGFLDLIDYLMQRTPSQRPENTAAIFKEIASLTPIVTSQSNSYQLPSAISAPIATPLNVSQSVPTLLSPPVANSPQSPVSPVLTEFAPAQVQPVSTTLNKKRLLLIVGLSSLIGLAAIATLVVVWKSSTSSTSSNTGEAFNEIKNVPNGTFKFGGSTTWATTRQQQSSVDATIKGGFPKFDIVYTDASSTEIKSVKDKKCDGKPGSNAGICWLIEGDLDFAQSSVSLDKSKFADQAQAHKLKDEAVAYDALSVVVNTTLKIPGLTVDQLRDIYTGKITNWSQVNGPNLPIIAYSRPESAGGTVSSFKDLALKKGDELKFQVVKSTTEGLQQVKNNPGGIYYGAGQEVIVDSCYTQPLAIGKTADNLVKPYEEPLQPPDVCSKGKRNKMNTKVIKNQDYPLTRKIYVIFKADGSDRQKAGEAYINLLKTKQGQDLLEKAGFVSIRN